MGVQGVRYGSLVAVRRGRKRNFYRGVREFRACEGSTDRRTRCWCCGFGSSLGGGLVCFCISLEVPGDIHTGTLANTFACVPSSCCQNHLLVQQCRSPAGYETSKGHGASHIGRLRAIKIKLNSFLGLSCYVDARDMTVAC